MSKKIGIILIGGTGYGAKEFLRLSLNHRELEIFQVCSTSEQGNDVQDTHKELLGLMDKEFSSEMNLDLLDGFSYKFLILALPHGESQKFVLKNFQECKEKQIHIIDLSGDFRIKNKTVREYFYPSKEDLSPDILSSFAYGLSEINREEIKTTTNIANPGCFSSGAILSLSPLVQSFSDRIMNIAIDGKSGSSGGGKNPNQKFHHPELNSSSYAYSQLTHRHLGEIEESLSMFGLDKIAFTPHVIPISRGMIISSYVFSSESLDKNEILDAYKAAYKDEPFIRIRESSPEIRLVAGSNFLDLNIVVKNNIVSITACLDNLIKGMAGQAIQNINIISDLDETTGLRTPALGLI